MSYQSNGYYTSSAAPGHSKHDAAAGLARKAAKAGVSHLLKTKTKPQSNSGYDSYNAAPGAGAGYGIPAGYGTPAGYGQGQGHSSGMGGGKGKLAGMLAKEGVKMFDKARKNQKQGQQGYGQQGQGQQPQWRDDQAFGGFAHPDQQRYGAEQGQQGGRY